MFAQLRGSWISGQVHDLASFEPIATLGSADHISVTNQNDRAACWNFTEHLLGNIGRHRRRSSLFLEHDQRPVTRRFGVEFGDGNNSGSAQVGRKFFVCHQRSGLERRIHFDWLLSERIDRASAGNFRRFTQCWHNRGRNICNDLWPEYPTRSDGPVWRLASGFCSSFEFQRSSGGDTS